MNYAFAMTGNTGKLWTMPLPWLTTQLRPGWCLCHAWQLTLVSTRDVALDSSFTVSITTGEWCEDVTLTDNTGERCENITLTNTTGDWCEYVTLTDNTCKQWWNPKWQHGWALWRCHSDCQRVRVMEISPCLTTRLKHRNVTLADKTGKKCEDVTRLTTRLKYGDVTFSNTGELWKCHLHWQHGWNMAISPWLTTWVNNGDVTLTDNVDE